MTTLLYSPVAMFVCGYIFCENWLALIAVWVILLCVFPPEE
jgi:hypothetical protein